MTPFSRRTLLASLAVGMVHTWGNAVCLGQDEFHAADYNPWTRFGVGSWKKVRTLTETPNETGKGFSLSIKEMRTTLVEVQDVSFTLKIEASVDVAGKRFVADAHYVKQGYHGEVDKQTVDVKKVGDGEVVIDGRKFPSEIRQVIVNGDELKRVSLIHFSDAQPPHILKRETKATGRDTTAPSYEAVVEVVSIEMPFRVMSELKSAAVIKTTHRKANGGATVVIEHYCHDVPGGIVAVSSRELSPEGLVVMRESVELSEYQANPLSADSTLTTPNGQRRRLFQRSSRPRSS